LAWARACIAFGGGVEVGQLLRQGVDDLLQFFHIGLGVGFFLDFLRQAALVGFQLVAEQVDRRFRDLAGGQAFGQGFGSLFVGFDQLAQADHVVAFLVEGGAGLGQLLGGAAQGVGQAVAVGFGRRLRVKTGDGFRHAVAQGAKVLGNQSCSQGPAIRVAHFLHPFS
jgi:hypothetical protein